MDLLKKLLPLKQTRQTGFILPTLIGFMVIVTVLGAAVVLVSVQAYNLSVRQQYIQQAQLASSAGLEFAKEQYELDIGYTGTSETDLNESDQIRTTYEVQQLEYLNAQNTQQRVRAIGRVYLNDVATPIAEREIIGTVTRLAGSNSSFRFVFIIDNSGSMSVSEWLDSKETVDIAIRYVLEKVPNGEVAVVQYGTNHYSREHKYDVTVPFTSDEDAAVNWDRRYGPGTAASSDYQDHLAASLARMRDENVYGPGAELDLVGATNVQYVLFTDAYGGGISSCCSALKHLPSSYDTTNNGSFTTMLQHGEFNALKDGSVFASHGYSGLTAQFTVLNINQTTAYETVETSAGIASPGGEWTGDVDENPDDPEGEGILPRRYINTSLLATDPNDILVIIDEIIQAELNI